MSRHSPYREKENPFDIFQEPDPKYRELLLSQLFECNRHKTDIFNRASSTFFSVVNRRNSFIVGISCDFLKLQSACDHYRPGK